MCADRLSEMQLDDGSRTDVVTGSTRTEREDKMDTSVKHGVVQACSDSCGLSASGGIRCLHACSTGSVVNFVGNLLPREPYIEFAAFAAHLSMVLQRRHWQLP